MTAESYPAELSTSRPRNAASLSSRRGVAILILLWIPIYAFVAIGIAAHVLPHANGVTAFVFYAVAGLLWAAVQGSEGEPLGNRIVEIPDDLQRFESRDPR